MCFSKKVMGKKVPRKKWLEKGISSIAKKDIVCYKVMNGLVSSYQNHEYTLGKLNRLVAFKFSYELFNYYMAGQFLNITRGYHSYTSLGRAKEQALYGFQCGRDIYKCIIPKGSEYLVNGKTREYVSNQIIILEKI